MNSDGWYFIALPDCAGGERVARRVGSDAQLICRHASGRPLLLARGPARQRVVVEGGAVRVAVIGGSSATEEGLRGQLGRPGGVRLLEELGHSLAGSFHLVAADGERLRLQGSASGLRRVFHAVIDGVRVVSDRADVLAGLGGFALDDTALAIRLLRVLPHPLAEEPMWREVEAVAPGSALLVEDGGRRVRTVVWWRRPAPELSRREGAERLRGALEAAVDVRTSAGGTVHCDLSGGLDSTPLCRLAARGPAEIVATTMYNDDPGGLEDLIWARRALPSMPNVRHDVGRLDDMPQFFEGIGDVVERLDEPSQAYLTAPRVRYSVEAAMARGATTYVNGLGGDHLLHGLPVWDHALFRRRPLTALRRVRTTRMLDDRPLIPVLRELLDSESYRAWLRRTVREARRVREVKSDLRMEWDQPVALPRWLSRDAAAALLARLGELAASAEPLGADRALHAELAMVRDGSRIIRGTQQYAATLGMPFEAPFFDDRVVEACFAVRHEERDSPMEFKPLIKAAMRGLLPDEFLRRGSKMGGSVQAARGLRDHWPTLLELCEQSPLTTRGVIDFDALATGESPQHMGTRDAFLDATVNCAVFARNQPAGDRRHDREEPVHGPAAA
ncbi:asparagine synthase-related protein [Streptomyces sp. L-9-10]|uniref:asparagine synthase-related protein n=1 Tax=Streptomyces sp. L-9-10 TaxID=1478131 RepID=UPI00101C9794|nr:asparagine synthase-related protein [Streptomyces sp. L-9-10]